MPSSSWTDQAWNQRQNLVDQCRQDSLAAVLDHHLVEAAVALVGNATAFAEAAHDVVFDRAEKWNVLREDGEIAAWRIPGDQGGVLER